MIHLRDTRSIVEIICALILFAFLEVMLRNFFGWMPDLMLSFLLAFALYGDLFSLVAYISVSAFLMKWDNSFIHSEFLALLSIPLLALFLGRYVPHDRWTPFLFGVCGAALWYLVSSPARATFFYLEFAAILFLDGLCTAAIYTFFLEGRAMPHSARSRLAHLQ